METHSVDYPCLVPCSLIQRQNTDRHIDSLPLLNFNPVTTAVATTGGTAVSGHGNSDQGDGFPEVLGASGSLFSSSLTPFLHTTS
jgi:hypothetical protein